jgi:predicted enzyme related to lactoylglutathione lyase
MKLRLLVLRSEYLERAKLFYEILGFQFKAERHGSGPLHYAAEMGDLVFELYPSSSGRTPDDTRLGFGVLGLETVVNKLDGMGTPIISSHQETSWGPCAIIRDPDGRAVELYEAQPGV